MTAGRNFSVALFSALTGWDYFKQEMEARNKHTKEICEVYWDMCDIGRCCEASDKPITPGLPCRDYNSVIDDYDVLVNGEWIDGKEYIKNPYAYWNKTK